MPIEAGEDQVMGSSERLEHAGQEPQVAAEHGPWPVINDFKNVESLPQCPADQQIAHVFSFTTTCEY